MQTISGNLLDIKKGILCHQTNCLGIAGGGIALQIRNQFPGWYIQYKQFCEIKPKLGDVLWFKVNKDLYIANLFCQDNIGGKATVESSYGIALPKIKIAAYEYDLNVFFPWMIGCGLGGGNFDIIQEKIKKYLPYSTFVKYEN